MKVHKGQCLFSDGGLELEYEDLVENIEEFGKQLSSIQMENNKICALVLPNGIDMAISFLALASYVTVSPLNPNYTKEEFLFFLEDLDCEFIITDNNASNSLMEAAKQLKIKLFYLNNYSQKNRLSIKSLSTASKCWLDQNKADDICLINLERYFGNQFKW